MAEDFAELARLNSHAEASDPAAALTPPPPAAPEVRPETIHAIAADVAARRARGRDAVDTVEEAAQYRMSDPLLAESLLDAVRVIREAFNLDDR